MAICLTSCASSDAILPESFSFNDDSPSSLSPPPPYTLNELKNRLQNSQKFQIDDLLSAGTVSLPTKEHSVDVDILHRGISLGLLIALTETFQLYNFKTKDVVKNFITPVTACPGGATAQEEEQSEEEEKRDGDNTSSSSPTDDCGKPCRFSELGCVQEFFGKADTFVSHCWEGTWGDLVAACTQDQEEDRIVWIDIFAVTQHPQMDALQDDLNALQYVIDTVHHGTTLIWNPQVQKDAFSNPVLRAWCLFEIHTTVLKDNALVIKMGRGVPKNSTKIKRRLKTRVEFIPESNEDVVTELVYSTDIRNAKATVPEDLERIHEMIQSQGGGFDELNTRVRTAVYNNWRIMQIPAVQYALSGSRSKIESFLEVFDPETYEGDPGGSLLHDLVHGNFCNAAQLVLRCGATIDHQTKKGNTPLMFAAEGGRDRMCKLLIGHGASLDLQNNRKETALHLAAKYGRVEATKLLLEAGADVNIQDSGEYTPAGLARLNKMPGCREVLNLLEPSGECGCM